MKKRNFVYILLATIILLGVGACSLHDQKTVNSDFATWNSQTNISPTSKTSKLTQDNAVILAINTVINSKITANPRNCIYAEVNTQTKDTITFDIRENHNKDCGGDPQVSPMIVQAVVNLITQKVTIVE